MFDNKNTKYLILGGILVIAVIFCIYFLTK